MRKLLSAAGGVRTNSIQFNSIQVLEKSEIVVVRYSLPFGLDAAPDAESGQVVVTKDGKGGEKIGDILRKVTPIPKPLTDVDSPNRTLAALEKDKLHIGEIQVHLPSTTCQKIPATSTLLFRLWCRTICP